MNHHHFRVTVTITPCPTIGAVDAALHLLAVTPGVEGCWATHTDDKPRSVTVTIFAWADHTVYRVVVPQIVKLAEKYPTSSTRIEITLLETAPTP